MSDMKTYLEQNAYEPETIITRSVKEPESWDEVATAIKSAIFDYVDLHREVLQCTDYLYVGLEALFDDPHKEAVCVNMGIPTTIKHSFISLPTRDFDEEYLVPNAKRLIRQVQKAGLDEPNMSSCVTVFVAEINLAEIRKKETERKVD